MIFLRNIHSKRGRSLLAKLFTLHLKYIDDFFYGGTNLTIDDLLNIYPSWVQFDVTSTSNNDGSIQGVF
jgi:hypothetical protein